MDNECNIYIGRGNASMQEDYVDFINYIFGYNGVSDGFYQLLPKLYPEKYDPAANSFVVTENGKLRAAVGSFPHSISVCGITLNSYGIGNVAVHPAARSKGYMRELMKLALDDMLEAKADISILGGRRQRYNYFSYDKVGQSCSFTVNSDNIRHTFGGDYRGTLTLKAVGEQDGELLDKIAALSDTGAYHPIRPREDLYAIMCSWHMKPYAVLRGEDFAGYCLIRGDRVYETQLADSKDMPELAVAAYRYIAQGHVYFTLPVFETEKINSLCRLCEGYSIDIPKSFSVLNYRRVIDAFMRLKQTYATLPDGRLIMLIHGFAGDERLAVEVSGGAVSVTPTDASPNLELDHLTAMNLLFATLCPQRNSLPDFARLWLPLPIWLYYADAA